MRATGGRNQNGCTASKEDDVQQSMGTAQREILKLSEALLLCQSELAQVRENQEPLQEQVSLLRAQNSDSHALSADLARSLADQLSREFWERNQPMAPVSWRRFLGSRWPWLKKLFGNQHSAAAIAELEQIRLIEASPLFESTWYLKHYVDVALAGINPATHYLRSGAQEGRDPGPEFSTRGYIARHPELGEGGLNPLIHHLQSQSP
jgi:hypothetical protein